MSELAPLSTISVVSGALVLLSAPLSMLSISMISDVSKLPLSMISDSSVRPASIDSDVAGAQQAPLFTWITSISDLSRAVSEESTTISIRLSFWRSEPTSSASILLHLTILVMVSSPPVKPSCDWFGAREIVNLTFLPICLVLTWASWYSATISFLHSEHLTRWR